jgi:hypothetical protein
MEARDAGCVMSSEKENACQLVLAGIPQNSVRANGNTAEQNTPACILQVSNLMRRCAISAEMAEIVATLVFGKAPS